MALRDMWRGIGPPQLPSSLVTPPVLGASSPGSCKIQQPGFSGVVSVTDQWAGMSLAGPKARAALELALPGIDVTDAAVPYMSVRELEYEGAPLRLLRLSFSGELAYELYVPADHGVALWERLLARAAPLGIKPYGLEALASLRIEKGHVAGLELDHRNTLDDLGLGKMASRDKPYVGRELRGRTQLQAPERWSLVGLECLEAGQRLRGGAILFADGEQQVQLGGTGKDGGIHGA